MFLWRNKQNEPRHDKTNKVTVHPAKSQISLGIRPLWSESLMCAQWVAKDPSFLHADSEDCDQTGRMPRLIWVFAGRTLILLVLSWGGSNYPLIIIKYPPYLFCWLLNPCKASQLYNNCTVIKRFCKTWPRVIWAISWDYGPCKASQLYNNCTVIKRFCKTWPRVIWAISWDYGLFILRKLILQSCMCSHPVGLDVWFFFGPFNYFHTLCVWTAKAVARLRTCAGLPEPSLVAYVTSTIISWVGLFDIWKS